jgi:two-component system cell cycle response regulator DivK
MARKKVLIVDDDPMSRKLARDVLQANGYDTDEVSNGEEAVTRAGQTQPDLIVMDIRLTGIDGLEATRRLKGDTATAGIPVIAVTAHAMPGDEEKALAAGCQVYLPKPLSFRALVSVVKTLLGDPETS